MSQESTKNEPCTTYPLISVLWLNKYIHILNKAPIDSSNPILTLDQWIHDSTLFNELLNYSVKCALSLTPFLKTELPQLKFEL